MDFVDNVIDRSSGTIRGRAVFANPDGVLTPGMFGRIRVPGSPPYKALAGAGCRDRHRADRANSCWWSTTTTPRVQKYVTLGPLSDDNLRVIKDGITADDRVIVNGLMRARPGAEGHAAGAGPTPAGPAGPQAKASVRHAGRACGFRISSSTGRSSRPSSRSCS